MKNVTKWVQGNTLPLAVKLYEIVAIEGGFKRQAYEAPAGSIYAARIVGKRTYNYECDVSGNVVTFVDDGTLPCGYYGVEVTVKEPERNLRTFKCMQLEIVSCTCEMNLGEFLSPDALAADSDVFFWAKGDKGDPMTYDDLTEAQKADLIQGCYQRVPNIGISEENGVTQVKSEETFPVAHPDLAQTATLLPQRFLGNKVYEQVCVLSGTSIYSVELASSNACVIEAHCFNPQTSKYKAVEMQKASNTRWTVVHTSTNTGYNLTAGDFLIVRYFEITN